MNKKNTIIAVSCILLQSAVYGLGNPLTKIAYLSITPFWCLTFRFALAFLVFAVFFRKRIIAELRAVKVSQYAPASLSMAMAYITCNVALSMTTATNVGFFISLPVIFVPLLAKVFFKQQYNIRHLPWQIAVVAGLILLCMQNGHFHFNAGDFFALTTAVFAAASLIFGKQTLKVLSPVAMAATQTGTAAILSLFCALFFDDMAIIPGIQPAAWAVIVYLALTCSCLAYVMQNLALARTSASLVSMLQCTQPILTAVISWSLLNESMTAMGMAGAVIIIVCTVAESRMDQE